MRYWLHTDTSDTGDLRDKQRRVVEAAAECFSEVERYREDELSNDEDERGVAYEACDAIQAALDLLAALGVTQAELDATMDEVRRHDEERGRRAS